MKIMTTMLWQKLRFAVIVCLCFFSVSGTAQTITYDTTIAGWNAKVTMRADFNYSTDSVQGIVFIPGTGECGTDISKLLIYGPHYWMTQGWNGSVSLGNGTHYPVIISLQPPAVNQRPSALKTRLDAILSRYRIKRKSLHLTGISQGGWVVNIFATYKPSANDYTYYSMVRSIVNVEGVVPDDTYDASLPYPRKFGNWAKFGGRELWFEQSNDYRNMENGAVNMNDSVPSSATYVKTRYGGGGHSDFDKFYNPANNNWTTSNTNVVAINGKPITMNTYQWMLRNGDTSLSGAPAPPPPPPPPPPPAPAAVANAGTDQGITLPANSVTLNGSGSTGTITSYAWIKLTGGAATISTPTAVSTTVSGLVQGVYEFQLTVNGLSTAKVRITVNPAASLPTTPPSGHYIIGLGEYQTFIIAPNGKLYGLSSSASAVGTGSASGSAVPPVLVNVPSNLTFSDAASGLHHSLAVDNNGDVWTWGWNDDGQAGNGTGSAGDKIYTPVRIQTDSLGNRFTGVKQVVAYYSYNKFSGNVALKNDGTVWVWGNTGGGMRGNGTVLSSNNRPVQVIIPGNRKIKKVVAAEVVLALAEDGTVWAWGGGGFRTMNLGTNDANYTVPKQVVNLPSNITDIAGASNFYYAVTSAGVPYGWGYFGVYMGVGTDYANNTPIYTPRNLTADLNLPKPIASIVCNTVATHVILTDGTLWGWGDNAQGTIGNGVELDFSAYNPPYAWSMGPAQLMQTKPVQILPNIKNFTHVFGGTAYVFYSYALTSDGKLFSWGRNKGGVLGNGVVSATSSIAATYPNSWDVPTATQVDPLGLTKETPQTSPYCIANPSGSPCNGYGYTPGKPTVSAGVDQVFNLPKDSVVLSGTASSPNGTISTYNWSFVSGPAAVNFTSAAQQITVAKTLVQGVYRFALKVVDNQNATSADTITVTVNAATAPAPNRAPTAAAGSDLVITLPINTATLNGSGTDTDGNISAYNWIKVSGPNGGTLGTPGAAQTNISSLIAGIYVFRLTVTDNGGLTASDDVQVTVNAAPAPSPNQAPTASAGQDIIITLPVNTSTLNGSGADTDGTISTYSWIKVSGPSGGNLGAPAATQSAVSGLLAGVYVFRLTVTDNGGLTASDDIQITVNNAAAPSPNQAPTASAGTDIIITLPVNTTTLNGSGRDTDGTISTYAWSKQSGPTGGTIGSSASAQTGLSNLVAGVYVFRLTVTDNGGLSSSDDIQVTVNAAPAPSPNQAPTASAGQDIVITLPVNTSTLSGSGADTDGTISTYAWSKQSGPSGGTIGSPSAAQTGISNLVAGDYIFRLTVTDNGGLSSSDDIQIRVNAAPAPSPNQAPTASAGQDIVITLPVNTATLNGSGIDTDGTISTYSWTKQSGPAIGTIGSSAAAQTDVSNLVAGDYIFRLTVTDNGGLSSSDDIQVRVNAGAPAPAPNQAPSASAGQDIVITLPVNTATLNGSGTDTDGSISGFNWTLVSGPAGSTMSSTIAAQVNLSNLVAGVYVFRLSVTDNGGLTSSDEIQVVVKNASVAPPAVGNWPPVIMLSDSFEVRLPIVSTELDASKSYDSDGRIVSLTWSVISGPSNPQFVSPDNLKTVITNLRAGFYTVNLRVQDNSGATVSKSAIIKVVTGSNRVSIPITKVYPNPVIDKLNVSVESDIKGKVKIRIIDFNGRVVIRKDFIKTGFIQVFQLELGHLRKGMYTVWIQEDLGVPVMHKIVH